MYQKNAQLILIFLRKKNRPIYHFSKGPAILLCFDVPVYVCVYVCALVCVHACVCARVCVGACGWLVGWLYFTPLFTVPCDGCDARFLHRSHRELRPWPLHGSPLHYRCALQLYCTVCVCVLCVCVHMCVCVLCVHMCVCVLCVHMCVCVLCVCICVCEHVCVWHETLTDVELFHLVQHLHGSHRTVSHTRHFKQSEKDGVESLQIWSHLVFFHICQHTL